MRRVTRSEPNGEVIEVYPSLDKAVEDMIRSNCILTRLEKPNEIFEQAKVEITKCLEGKSRLVYFNCWSYTDPAVVYRRPKKIGTKVNRYSKEGDLLQSYDSLSEAAKHMINKHCVGNSDLKEGKRISRVATALRTHLAGKTAYTYGYIWKYK